MTQALEAVTRLAFSAKYEGAHGDAELVREEITALKAKLAKAEEVIKELEETTINGVLSGKLRDANETICEQRALLEECIDTVKIVADSFYEDNEGTVVNDIPLHIRRRAASLIEKLEGMG